MTDDRKCEPRIRHMVAPGPIGCKCRLECLAHGEIAVLEQTDFLSKTDFDRVVLSHWTEHLLNEDRKRKAAAANPKLKPLGNPWSQRKITI